MLNHLSAVIISRDCEETIGATLKSLSRLKEVIVYDNGSSDRTVAIAGEFPNVRIVQGPFIGFGPTRNRAANYAEHDWILAIDSDEEAETDLIKELADLTLDQETAVYSIRRDNYFLDRKICHAGWGKDRLDRLYNRQHHRYDDKPVHEAVKTGSDTIRVQLNGRLKHRAVRDVAAFLKKTELYSGLNTTGPAPAFPMIVIRSWLTFIKCYILQLGFLEGWRGYVIARANANGNFFKYLRRYQKCAR